MSINSPFAGGDPKTLIPGPRTPTTDRVRGLPMDRSTNYPYGPPLRTTLQNRIKIINKYFSYWLSNRLLVTAKFRPLPCANVTDLDSGSSAIYIITHVAISFAVAIKYMKDAYGKASSKPRNLCSFPSAILFSPFSRGSMNSFQASQFAQRNNRFKQE